MLIMPGIYVVSPKSSRNSEFFFLMEQYGQCGGWGSGSGERLSHGENEAQRGQMIEPRSQSGGGGARTRNGCSGSLPGALPSTPLGHRGLGLRRTYLVGASFGPGKTKLSLVGGSCDSGHGLGCREVATEYGSRRLPRMANGKPWNMGAGAPSEDTGGPRPHSVGFPVFQNPWISDA